MAKEDQLGIESLWMGNKLGSGVADAVKAQAVSETAIDRFINVKGKGELVDLMREALKTRDYSRLDDRIREGFRPFLYNQGAGRFAPVTEIVSARCRNKKSEVKKNEDDVSKMEVMSEDKDIRANGQKYKEVCWSMDQRGSVGETPLHVCLLKSSPIHANLAKRILLIYPKLICDIYLSEEYYGENMLHMAIVNEEPAMVRFLLDKGADLHQRCCGNFFTPDDQKISKRDSFEHEWYDLNLETNYYGYTYWGEYPLSFAVCLGQEDSVRLLNAKNVDLDLQDSNGNSALHLIVIHYKQMSERAKHGKNYCEPEKMFDLLVEMGAKLHLINRQGLTPLALAAKLGRKEMYDHIMQLDREVYWIFGEVVCAGYPLDHIDSIKPDGQIDINSVTYHIVFGVRFYKAVHVKDEPEHLEMIEGTVAQLLHEKWKTFAKYRFFRRFILFILYFLIFLVAFTLRPGTVVVVPGAGSDDNVTSSNNNYNASNSTNLTQQNSDESAVEPDGDVPVDPCYLLVPNTTEDIVRLVFEGLTVVGSIIYIFLAIKEIFYQGFQVFSCSLTAAPSKSLFLISNCIVILMIPGRAGCASQYEDVMAVLALLSTAPYFLFFCRGFKVGPFVVMIYKMIRTDLSRFLLIYIIFVIGFSQSMFILFRGYNNESFNTALESILGMFRMSLGAFADVYETFEKNITNQLYLIVPKIIFVVYMVLVTLLLMNMLIAMMGHTYESVNESRNEWLRQWAKIILVIEQTVTTDARRDLQINYFQPMKDGRRALALRWHNKGLEKIKLSVNTTSQKS